MKVINRLTEKQIKLAEEWYLYSIKVTMKWAVNRDALWCIDELKSAAGFIVTRCALKYQENHGEKFITYLTSSLFRFLPMQYALFKGYKPLKKERAWYSIFVEMEKDISEMDFLMEMEDITNRHIFANMDFEEILKMSKTLKERDKEIARDLFVRELNGQEIADKRNCSREFIRQRKDKIIKTFRKILGGQNGKM